MLESLVTRKHDRSRLRAGPMHAYLTQVASALLAEQYQPRTVRRYLFAADAFGRWLQRRGVPVHAADERALAGYIESLGRFRCGARPRGRLPVAASGARTVLDVLRQHGVVAPRPCATESAADRWLTAYDCHLDRVGGLSEGTRRIYVRYAHALATMRFGSATPDWSVLSADDIVAFVRREAAALSPSSCRSPVTATRALLRFLTLRGAVPPGLDAAAPTIRRWKHAALPQHLSGEEVERMLARCDLTTPLGRRDRAILLLLVRLGLRPGEIVALHLDDIDWRAGRVMLRGTKSARDRALPLTQEVGDALVAYLREGRPISPLRAVFLRERPPYHPLKTSSSVSVIARRYLRRAAVAVPCSGAHVLRHTAATQMVRGGARFKDIADVLGHARLETTAIYAKVDLEALERVALPWPGGAR